MPNYRRNFVPGGTFFFTVTLRDGICNPVAYVLYIGGDYKTFRAVGRNRRYSAVFRRMDEVPSGAIRLRLLRPTFGLHQPVSQVGRSRLFGGRPTC